MQAQCHPRAVFLRPRALARPRCASTSQQPVVVTHNVVVSSDGDLTAVDGLGEDVPLGTQLSFDGQAKGILLARLSGFAIVLRWPACPAPLAQSQATVRDRAFATVPHPDSLLHTTAALSSLIAFTPAPPTSSVRPARCVMAEIPGVPVRTPITQSLHTGVAAVDVLTPVGRGQCMLVVGERASGKTALALDAVASSRLPAVYASLSGPPAPASPHSITVSPPADASPGVAFLTLCAAFALAEAWRDEGRDALIVLDDLEPTVAFWAAATRLVPAPVAADGATGEQLVEFDGMLVAASAAERRRWFSSFLQRCARLNVDNGGGSLTLLALLASPPGAYRFGSGALAAAQAERKVASYSTLSEAQRRKLLAALEATKSAALADAPPGTISRPVIEEFMSVSDGQVFLQPPFESSGPWLFSPRDSVSRIGLDAAAPALRTAGSGAARLELVQADDADAFAAGSAGSPQEAAARLRAALVQRAGAPVALSQQVIMLLALRNGVCDKVPAHDIAATMADLARRLRTDTGLVAALDEIDDTGVLSPSTQAALLQAMGV